MSEPKGSMTLSEYREWLKKEGQYEEVMNRKKKLEQEHRERVAELHRAQAPIAADLRAAGYDVEAIWDLRKCGRSYGDVLPLLADHFQRPHPSKVRASLAGLLGIPEAREEYWSFLMEQFDSEGDAYVKDSLANSIVAICTEDRVDDVIDLVQDPSQGSSRILLLSVLEKTRNPRGWSTLEELADDPDLKIAIAPRLRKRKKRKRRSESTRTVPTPPSEVPPRDDLEELSMNFDLEDVPAFLEAIAEKIGPSLPTATVRDIVDTIEGMDVEEELSWALEVDFEGRSVPLQVTAFMDDTDAPDLLLFTVPDLARRLESVFEAHMK